MKALKILFLLFLMSGVTSCYEDYVTDYEYSTVGFIMKKPLRTVIADRDMQIYVGVSIGGKRVVDKNDWATFEIDPDLIPRGYAVMPENYYVLSDPATMRVRKDNLPVADVGIKFTDDFYNDDVATTSWYALPIRITGSSLDSIGNAETVVAIKFISSFHGTYYIKGNMEVWDMEKDSLIDTVEYSNKDLIKNITRDVESISRNTVVRPGVANFQVTPSEKIQLTIERNDNPDKIYNVLVGRTIGGINITDGSGTYYGNREKPEMEIKYSFEKGGKRYRVEETMILRQDPLYDLRVEEWQDPI